MPNGTIPVDTEALAAELARVLRDANLTDAELKARQERAWEAAKVFRKMIPQLSGFARAIARSNAVKVQMAPAYATGSFTDGKTIYIAPPIELGDKTRHERNLCDERGDDGLYLCPACRVRDKCMRIIYHELGHHCCESFQSLEEDERARLAQRAVELGEPKAFVKWAQKRLAEAKSWEKATYVGATKFISPFFPTLVNSLEDARVNLAMGAARPGIAQTFEANYKQLFEQGIYLPNGQTVLWRDREPNSQIIMALFAKASGYDYSGWFSQGVEQVLADKEIGNICWRLTQCRSIKGVYELAMPALVRLRELGYCRSPEDDDVDEPEPQQGQPGESGDEGESGDGSDADSQPGESSGDSPDEGSESDGSQGSSDGSGAQEPEGERDDAGDGSGESSEEQDEADQGDESEAGDGPGSADEAGSDGQGDEVGNSRGEPGTESDEGQSDGDESLDEGGDSGSGSDSADGDDQEQDDLGSADADGDGDSDADMAGDEGGKSQSPDGESGHSDNVTDELSDTQDPTAGGAGGEYSQRESERADSQTEGMESGDLSDRQSEHSETADDLPDDDTAEGQRGEGNINLEPVPGDDGQGEEAQLEEGEGDETIDTGADEGEGGVKVDHTTWGTAEQAQEDLDEIGGHGTAEQARKDAEELDRLLVDRAIMQSEYFETPSHNIAGVRIHEYDKLQPSSLGWTHDEPYMRRYSKTELGIAMPTVEEHNLGRALMATRHAFDANRQHKKERNLRSGRVDARRLGRRAPVDDERLFQRRQHPGKRDYLVIIGIDISGSTQGENILLAKQAAMAQAELCNRVGVKFEVWAHTEMPSHFDPSKDEYGGQSMLDMFLVKTANEPWDGKRKERLANLGPCYGNLDGHSIEFYRKRLEQSRATDKVLLYYTDGKMPASNYDEELEILQREIEVCKRLNIALMGVGIRTNSPVRHGLDTVQVNGMDEIEKVVAHLEKKLHG